MRELWVTDWANVEGGDEARRVFGDLAGFGREMMEAISSASAMPSGLGPGFGGGLFEQREQIDGFPVVTREYDGGPLETVSTLRSVQRRTLDPAAFEPPVGYRHRPALGTP